MGRCWSKIGYDLRCTGAGMTALVICLLFMNKSRYSLATTKVSVKCASELGFNHLKVLHIPTMYGATIYSHISDIHFCAEKSDSDI